MSILQSFFKILLLSSLFVSTQVFASAVPVHDPSVVIVYKDASGNSFPSNDAGATRTKYYYIFGTQLGAAYSLDMINWTSFTPTFSLNGAVSKDYYNIFKSEADYANQLTTNDVSGNLWAPDIIFNPKMNKWCLYFSLSGYDFKSSIILLTSTKIEGPYTKSGVVVYGGFTNSVTSPARTDYAKATGTNTVNSRYLKANGTWNNDYGVSCIDPSVLYDESGKLWLNYGSWSGGIFLLELDENTGLRDYSITYSNTYSGTRLRSDAYLGKHIAGGYYVSGEGPYVEYIKDENGVGYYYLFVSMGFYSPEGGYTMRVFRSATIDGIYKDVTGDEAVFANWVFNYGNNTQYGFPIMQNYKWDWWATGAGEVAQGHNSVLQDEDGKTYLVYHRKFDNATAFHNVEVHQLYFNDKGWPLSSPFETRVNYGKTNKIYTADDIAGLYGVITHNSVDYANLATNKETQMYLNADGTISGSYTGTWTYNYSSAKQYITLTTSAGTFNGVLLEELMNDVSSKTIAFTSMNAANERALWGYKYPNTKTVNTVKYNNKSLVIGSSNYDLVWDAYNQFHSETASGDFEVEYTFKNNTLMAENWHNWAIALVNGSETWYLRADAYSNSTFTGATVGYSYTWNWDTEYKNVFKNKDVKVKITKIGTTINVLAFVGDVLVYRVSSLNSPAGSYKVYLGGEAVNLEVKKVSVATIGSRQLVGRVSDYGTYPAAFNTSLGQTTAVSGDFVLNYNFNNYHSSTSKNNWGNFILRAISTGNPMLLRADAFALDIKGAVTYTYDWNWDNFLKIISDANIDLNISRKSNTITYTFVIKAKDGLVYNYQVINTSAPTGAMSFGFTCEESMVDILSVEKMTTVGGELITGLNQTYVKSFDVYTDGKTVYLNADKNGEVDVFDIMGRKIKTLTYIIGQNNYTDFGLGVFIVDRSKLLIVE